MLSGYYQAAIGEIPHEWEVRKVKDLFDVETGTTPSTKKREYWEGGAVNWLTPTDLSRLNGTIHVKASERKITEEAMKESNLTLMPKGSIIISTRAPVGYVAVLDEAATFNQGCKGLIPKNSDEIDSEFYCYFLLSRKWMLENLSGGSTFKELSKRRLESFDVPFLPLQEQRRIAEVLSSIGHAIRRVDEAITTTKQLKKGLMHKLLTEGVGHKEFKETEIGKIPETWTIAKLGQLADLLTGYPFKSKSFSKDSSDTKLVRGINVTTGRLRWDKGNTAYWKEMTPDLQRYLIQANDVLIGMDGALVGKNYAIADEKDLPLLLVQRVARLRAKGDLNPRYLYYQIGSSRFVRYVDRVNTSSGIAHISGKQIGDFDVPVPPLSERQKIVDILSAVDHTLLLRNRRKEKFERIKKGLMNDLLFGRRRVKVAM